MRRAIALILGSVVLPCEAQVESSIAAERFVEHGAAYVMRECDLKRGKCGSHKLQIVESRIIEPNDQRMLLKTLAAPGLTIQATFLSVGKATKVDVPELEVTGGQWPLMHGLKVGDTRASVLALLGQPSGSTHQGPCIEYYVARIEATATLCFSEGRLEKVHWVYWRD